MTTSIRVSHTSPSSIPTRNASASHRPSWRPSPRRSGGRRAAATATNRMLSTLSTSSRKVSVRKDASASQVSRSVNGGFPLSGQMS